MNVSKVASEKYNLAVCNPEVAKQWHPTKNVNLRPEQFLPGSHATVWWYDELCNHEWTSVIYNRTGSKPTGCPYCSGRMVNESNALSTTHPQIATQWHPTRNNSTPYKVTAGSGEKVWWKCQNEECGYEWKARIADAVKRDGRCPRCIKHWSAVPFEITKQELEKLYCGEGLTLRQIGKMHDVSFNTVLNRLRDYAIPVRENKPQLKSHEQFVDEVNKVSRDTYSILGSYRGVQTKISFIHHVCGEIFDMTPNQFIHNDHPIELRCPKCGKEAYLNKVTKSHEQFVQEVMVAGEGAYVVEELYVDATTKISIKHLKCQRSFAVRPDFFVNKGTRCPYCKSSKGEKKIAKFLEHNRIPFEQEYLFDECKSKRALPFDFAILHDNGEVMCLIEYDGAQHFFPVFGSHSKIQAFERTQKHDGIKSAFCSRNNIRLIRIPYTEFDNIEQILTYELTEILRRNHTEQSALI